LTSRWTSATGEGPLLVHGDAAVELAAAPAVAVLGVDVAVLEARLAFAVGPGQGP
jgi:hypothetical protein